MNCFLSCLREKTVDFPPLNVFFLLFFFLSLHYNYHHQCYFQFSSICFANLFFFFFSIRYSKAAGTMFHMTHTIYCEICTVRTFLSFIFVYIYIYICIYVRYAHIKIINIWKNTRTMKFEKPDVFYVHI